VALIFFYLDGLHGVPVLQNKDGIYPIVKFINLTFRYLRFGLFPAFLGILVTKNGISDALLAYSEMISAAVFGLSGTNLELVAKILLCTVDATGIVSVINGLYSSFIFINSVLLYTYSTSMWLNQLR